LRDSAAIEADILLDDQLVNTSTALIVGGQAQSIDFQQDRAFKIPDGEIRKVISIVRDYANDVGSDRFYNLQFPFMIRWEFWVAILNILSQPSDLFDPTLQHNGFNHFWQRLAAITTWGLEFEVTFSIEQNGVTFEQVFTQKLADAFNFEGNTQWEDHTIDSFTVPGGVPLVNAGNKYITGFEDVEIRAQAKKVVGSIPSLANVGIVVWIETFKQGGIDDIRRITSFRVLSDNSWFKSIDGSDKTVVTNPTAGVFRGTVLIDHTKLPTNTKFTIYARIYEFTDASFKQFQNDDEFDFQDGTNYQFQDGEGGGAALEIGTAFKQDFLQILENPIPKETRALTVALQSPEICCFEMPVFAETVFTSDLNNDIRSPIFFWNNGYSTAVMELQKLVGGVFVTSAALIDDTFGTFFPFGFHTTRFSENTNGYLVEWAKVLAIKGTGVYRVKATGTLIVGGTQDQFSLDFCLREYNAFEIDGTVRIEYFTNKIIGDKNNDLKKLDFVGLNWRNQLRLPNSIFGADNSEFEEEFTKYENGEEVELEDSQVEKYDLHTGLLPVEVHRIIKIEILQANRVIMTDYNEQNPTPHVNREVKRDSNYEPVWDLKAPLSPVTVRFKQRFQNLNAKRC